jgi:hypothetical protein
VVFESLLYEGKEIAAHADINDEAQAVTVSKESTIPGGGAQTGRDGLPIWLLITALIAAAGSVPFIFYLRRRGKQVEDE